MGLEPVDVAKERMAMHKYEDEGRYEATTVELLPGASAPQGQ